MNLVSLVSVLILWSGDYTARLQFDGPLKSEIKGELIEGNDSDKTFKSNKSCEVYGRFEEVLVKEKNLPEKFIKVNFRFVCSQDGQPKDETQLATELIRASDLTTHSTTVFISNKYKKNKLKFEDYQIHASKKSSK